MLKISDKKNKGFTLIELLVVIAIIGLLASIVLVSLGPARAKSRDAKRQADLKQINLAMEMCYDDATCGGGEAKYIDTTAGADTLSAIGDFMPTVPKDPKDSDSNQYTWTDGTNNYYCVYTKSESETNTYYCASNKGTGKDTYSGTDVPTNADCCGFDLD